MTDFQAIPRPSSVGEFIEFATGREALKLVGDLRLSQAISAALYNGNRITVPARPTEPSAPDRGCQ